MRRMRIAAVVAGLMAVGGVFGSIAGTLVLAVWQLRIDGFAGSWAALGWCVVFGVVFGGGFGALLGPALALEVMRYVPLWRAVGTTTLATSVVGALVVAVTGNPFIALPAGIVGFMVSAAALQRRFPPPARALILEGGPR